MPFKVERKGRQWAVVNADSGRVLGKHETKQEAEAQLRAVKANTSKENSKGKKRTKKKAGGKKRG